PGLPEPLRGLRPARPGGDGLRHAGRRHHRRRAARGRGRRGRPRRARQPGRARGRDRARPPGPRASARRRPRARRSPLLGRARAPDARRLPRAARVNAAAVAIWTPGDPDPQPCLDSLAPQVDELVITVNPGGSPSTNGARAIESERTLGFGANINRGVAATTAPYVVGA